MAQEDSVNFPFETEPIKVSPARTLNSSDGYSTYRARGVFTPINESEEEFFERVGMLKP